MATTAYRQQQPRALRPLLVEASTTKLSRRSCRRRARQRAAAPRGDPCVVRPAGVVERLAAIAPARAGGGDRVGSAARAGLTGFHESATWVSLVLAAPVAVVAFGAATALLARGWRLRP